MDIGISKNYNRSQFCFIKQPFSMPIFTSAPFCSKNEFIIKSCLYTWPTRFQRVLPRPSPPTCPNWPLYDTVLLNKSCRSHPKNFLKYNRLPSYALPLHLLYQGICILVNCHFFAALSAESAVKWPHSVRKLLKMQK